MSEPVDRQVAKQKLIEFIAGTNMSDFYPGIYQAVQLVIDELPSVQTENILCKDCKHLQKWRSEESAKKFGQIYECARNVLNCPKPEDFCSHAERRTDESD